MTSTLALGVDAAIVLAYLAVAVVGFRYREKPGALPFVALAGLLAAMTLSIAFGRLGIPSESIATLVLFGPFVFASLAWLALAFDYTGRGPVVTRRLAGGLAGFGGVVLVVTVLAAVVPESLLAFWLLLVNLVQLLLVAAIGYGAVLVARSGVEYGDLPRSGSLVLSAVGAGLVAVTLTLTLTPALPFEALLTILEAILGVMAVLLLLVSVRYRVFATGTSAGHLARESVLEAMSAAVAITGRRDRLLDLNRAAEQAFDVDLPDDLGVRIDEALDVDPDETESGPLTVVTSEGRREFDAERSELKGRGGESVGHAYVLRDVTERRTHEQRLDVLNRVLRHNLRNDLDAIRGFAETMERDDPAVDDAALARQIRETAEDVADLGTTLSAADRLLDPERLESEPIDVDTVLEDVAETVGTTFPEASITVTSEDAPITIHSDRRILGAALEEVVENGVEHNDVDSPTVDLTAGRRENDVVIEVSDDGPGIPERERAVLLDGEERPLRHGSGLGLWLVYWSVTRLGGTLAFREREPRGSTVSIRLPD